MLGLSKMQTPSHWCELDFSVQNLVFTDKSNFQTSALVIFFDLFAFLISRIVSVIGIMAVLVALQISNSFD